MTLAQAVRHVFAHYIDFTGRARRSEFWWWMLFVFGVSFAAGLVDALFGWGGGIRPDGTPRAEGNPVGFLVSLALLPANLAVSARRLHDIGRTGWWLLISLVPLVGIVVLLWFWTRPSEGPNRFGKAPAEPKAA